VFLELLGGLAACVGGALIMAGAMRVTLWGAVAMGLTTAVGLSSISVKGTGMLKGPWFAGSVNSKNAFVREIVHPEKKAGSLPPHFL